MKLKLNNGAALLLLGAMPFETNFAPGDSAQTTVQFFGGVGQYALISRGCNEEVFEKQNAPLFKVIEKHKIPFRELNAAVEHKFAAPIQLGVRSSYLFDQQKIEESYFDRTKGLQFVTRYVSKDNLVMNPYLNLEWKTFGIGGGYFWSRYRLATSDYFGAVDSPISVYLRFGNRRSIYASTSLLHHIPLYGGGYYQLGLGSGKNPRLDWWAGLGFVGPYDKLGLSFKSAMGLQQHLKLNLITRLGFSEGIAESAIGVGLTYH